VVTVGSGVFDVGSVKLVYGHGTLAAPVRGAASSTLVAWGGSFAAGLVTRDDGFDFDGTLVVQGSTMVLLDGNGARLGQSTQLLTGSTLASASGLALEAGRTLKFSGAAVVEGRFTHHGAVAPDGPGSITFEDDVSGPGSFAGRVIFRGLYAPGTAAVDFGGGTLSLGTSGELALRIDGLAPGSFSQLADIGTLQAGDAALALAFAPDLALPDEGATLALLDFAAFDGAFDPARVRISGIDAQRVDLSRLGVDGTVAITPVPEPGTVAMMLAGLVAVVWRGRRGHVREDMEALALDHDGHGP
jgi:PEP-CTERM motif